MSTNPQNPDQDKEIDFGQISKTAGNLYNYFWNSIIGFTFFLRRNIVWISTLIIVGFGLGMLLDRTTTTYDHEMVVIPNFGSAEYVYDKIAVLESKIKSNDTLFLSQLGIKNADALKKIEIEPINDIYAFVNLKAQNFELVKLMAEDGDVNKIMEDPVTSMNYGNHKILISTTGKNSKEDLIDPILKYLNESDYYAMMQKSVIESIKIKIKSDETTIRQIDSLLTQFSSRVGKNMMNDKMVYYNENTQLNDVLRTKGDLIYDISSKKIELINADKIVKDSQVSINIKNTKSLNDKMKFVLPFLFVAMFIAINWFKRGFAKRKQNYIAKK